MNNSLVSNTGPLIALSLIDQIDILKHLFKHVFVPEAVNEEILEGGLFHRGVCHYQEASWIQIKKLSFSVEPLLQNVLDIGEASVIQLAKECNADFVLIDERKGRKIARDVYHLHVIGSARILLEAKKKGLIKSVHTSITEMREAGYWIHDTIFEFVLKEAGEL